MAVGSRSRRSEAVALLILLVLLTLVDRTPRSSASTHWVVTDDGKIQPQADSVFVMRRPQDLVALMQQEVRAKYIKDIKTDMAEKRLEAEEMRERNSVSVESRLHSEDEDCVAQGLPLAQHDLYISTLIVPDDEDGILRDEFALMLSYEEPDCFEQKMEFHLEQIDELESISKRSDRLESPAEVALVNTVLYGYRFHLKQYGHLVSRGLKEEHPSWTAYAFAANYWRIVGNARQALECGRRSLRLSPPSLRHVALMAIGNVLHRARESEDAASVLEAAAAVSPDHPTVRFALGSVQATLARLNDSASSFAKAAELLPGFREAVQRLHAVRCHQKIEAALEKQHRELERTLDDLQVFQKEQETWTKVLEVIAEEQADVAVRQRSRADYDEALERRKKAAAAAKETNSARGKRRKGGPRGRGKASSSSSKACGSSTVDELMKRFEAGVGEKEEEQPPPPQPATTTPRPPAPAKPSRQECEKLMGSSTQPPPASTVYVSPESKGFE